MSIATQTHIPRDPDILEAVTEVKLRDNHVVGLYYDMDAVIDYFSKTGTNILAGELMIESFTRPDTLVQLIRSGLLRLHPGITEDQIRKMVDLHNFRYWVHRINVALMAVMPTERPNTQGEEGHPLAVGTYSEASGSSARSTSELDLDSLDD